ncbi:hypothetical protein N7468_003053 [Penicillium chermesinum]|uniref:Uncharacterized protein n=1 Tax=Penicillium chermesinum TaxID=63820 RepID=A0A9W9TT00_9EURO|nr:uncharacterized protein N7468_003053 [Penicillium chermesinum]KAJ5238434.1 hypothetical protein N7468_003053 [Penicillium chermesinum]
MPRTRPATFKRVDKPHSGESATLMMFPVDLILFVCATCTVDKSLKLRHYRNCLPHLRHHFRWGPARLRASKACISCRGRKIRSDSSHARGSLAADMKTITSMTPCQTRKAT